MNAKIKTILILAVVALILLLAYFLFLKPSPEQAPLTSQTTGNPVTATSTNTQNVAGTDFLTLLLNIKNIKLDTSLLSDPAFVNLNDSSIELISDGTEGRPNPFAPLGVDLTATPVNSSTTTPVTVPSVTSPATTNPVTAPTKTPSTPTSNTSILDQLNKAGQ